jgi:acetylornithine deacetylase
VSLDQILGHLTALVACDTRNPPRLIDGESAVFRYCSDQVGADFQIRKWDHGDGHVSWFAVRGKPKVLFNVHLDTVPDGDGWEGDPRILSIRNGRAYGRGACDIKGAAAVLLALARQADGPLALLFTSDEEGAGGCCVANFLATGVAGQFKQVIVAEPTNCEAVLGHRGYLSVKTRFKADSGHSSEARALHENANHQMARWAAAALQVASGRKSRAGDPGTCLNIGLVDGGTKSNVIAGRAFVHWSARLQPGESNEEFILAIQACVPAGSSVEWEVPFQGEPLPAAGKDDSVSRRFCETLDLPLGKPVDFWTEAAIFSAADLPAIVLGPGHISQAHVTGEWVALEQLETAYKLYQRVVNSDG